MARARLPVRARARLLRHLPHHAAATGARAHRCRRGRRFARLREHAVPTARRRVHRFARERRRTCAVLRPGASHARRRNVSAHVTSRSRHARGRDRHGSGRHVPSGRCRRALRCAVTRSVLRRRRSGARHLHRLRRVHDRLPAQREEHAREELPVPRRAGRRRRARVDLGHERASPPRRLRGRDRPDRRTRTTPARGRTSLHRRPGRVRRGRARYRQAAARDARRRRLAARLGAGRTAHAHELRGRTRRANAQPRRRLHPRRGDHLVVPPRRAHPRRAGAVRQGQQPARADGRGAGRR